MLPGAQGAAAVRPQHTALLAHLSAICTLFQAAQLAGGGAHGAPCRSRGRGCRREKTLVFQHPRSPL